MIRKQISDRFNKDEEIRKNTWEFKYDANISIMFTEGAKLLSFILVPINSIKKLKK